MIYFDTFAHAQYAKNMCKSHKLLRSPETIVDFFPNQQPSVPVKSRPRVEGSFPPKFDKKPEQNSFRYSEPSQGKFLYKREHSSFETPPVKPGVFPSQEEFRPNRSRPSFSDNTSLELLYSFFSSPQNRVTLRPVGQSIDQKPFHSFSFVLVRDSRGGHILFVCGW